MSGKPKDITNQRFGRWTVISRADNLGTRARWLCRCDCGTERVIRGDCLRRNVSLSCGCLALEHSIEVHRKHNTYIFKSDRLEIYTEKGQRILADVEDFDTLQNYYWCVDNKGYARARIPNSNPSRCIRMHQVVLNCSSAELVDHKHGDTLDNRKSELRICSTMQNAQNCALRKDNTSGAKGVYVKILKSGKIRYVVHLGYNNRKLHIGTFDTKEEAIEVRKQAELKYYGEYSRDYGHLIASTNTEE